MDISVVTCTRDRPQAFSLCRRWLYSQDFTGNVEWLVVTDGDVPPDLGRPPVNFFPRLLRREPSPFRNTLPHNMLAGLAAATARKIVVWEDDDYYGPTYLSECARRLDLHDAVGEVDARYYNVSARRWFVASKQDYASLCRTSVTRQLLPELTAAAEWCREQDSISIDTRFWRNLQAREGLYPHPKLTVSIKGLPGRAGLGSMHADGAMPYSDPSGAKLAEWIGRDAEAYRRPEDENGSSRQQASDRPEP